MRPASKICGLFLWTAGLAAAISHTKERTNPPDIKALLLSQANRWSVNTTIWFPSQDGFVKATERWDITAPPTYSAAISPASEGDVVKALQLATRNKIPFLATGGRHGVSATLARLRSGLAVDLSQLNSVKVDQTTGTVIVGGGTRMGDVLDPLFAAGYELQIGSCSCPGLVGATIGGGLGRWQGLYGLISDALVSARVVTADGRLIEVSESSYPELFWGIRGAGANLGVVTSATYKLHKTRSEAAGGDGGKVVNMDFIFPAESAPAYFRALETYRNAVPPRLAGIGLVIYNQTANAPSLLANWVLRGTNITEAQDLLAPILQVPAAVVSTSVIPWSKIIATAGFGVDQALCVPDTIRATYSVNVRNVSAPTIETAFQKFTTFYAENPAGRGSALQFETFSNQAATSLPADATAYPWRDAKGHFTFILSYPNGDNLTAAASGALGRQLRQEFADKSGYPGLAVYVNNGHGDEPLESIYGRNHLPRLARLKKTWDPTGVFSFNHPLPVHYP